MDLSPDDVILKHRRVRPCVFIPLLALPVVTACATDSRPPSGTARLRVLEKQAQHLGDEKHYDDAILHLQRHLATLAATHADRRELARSIELLGDLAAVKAGTLPATGGTRPEARRWYSVPWGVYQRPLTMCENTPYGEDTE